MGRVVKAIRRVAIFFVAFWAIGLIQIFNPRHLNWLSFETLAAYQGGLNMLLILWFCGLLRQTAVPESAA